MSDTAATSNSPFSTRTVAILIAVAVFSFAAVMVLAGWAPELRDRNEAGDHPFSTSAIGYNGFYQLLEDQGYPVEISRFKHDLESTDWATRIVTLPHWIGDKALEDYVPVSTTLIVLPKWTGLTDRDNPKFQKDTRFTDASTVNDLLALLKIGGEVGRIDVPAEVDTPFGEMALKPDVKMQVIQSSTLEPVAGTKDGILLGQVPGEDIYVLADPDMINTFGLARIENARFAVQVIDYIRYSSDEPIVFDATLHGFERSENLLQMMFDVPFVGATLAAFATALLLGWAATVRFGPPAREGRVIALGKQALADNSAGLVTMARRETRMAPGYLALMRRRAAADIGAPKTLTEAQLSALFDRLGPEDQSGKTFSQIASSLKTTTPNRETLLHSARELWRWRHDILRRSPNDPK
ncbi:MAG: hypothetical protein R3C13_12135 [Hyphomonas sp.]|uniref:DUF4350 domain-containing protein n=1 Tax=Hyphomonas sp. TaxID=87 RepID=UPI003528AF08